MRTYRPTGDIDSADCVIGFSFGTSIGKGSVNEQLALQMLSVVKDLPLIADRTLVNAMPNGEARMAHIVEGDVTNIKARGVGTWGTLVEALRYMEENNLANPLIIAQAYHVRRVIKQAKSLGISLIVPEGLPTDFDRQSKQLWTRSVVLWLPFNTLGSLLLKKRGQL